MREAWHTLALTFHQITEYAVGFYYESVLLLWLLYKQTSRQFKIVSSLLSEKYVLQLLDSIIKSN